MRIDSVGQASDGAKVSRSGPFEDMVEYITVSSRALLEKATGDVDAFLQTLGSSLQDLYVRVRSGDPEATTDLRHVSAQVEMMLASFNVQAERKVLQAVGEVAKVALLTLVSAAKYFP